MPALGCLVACLPPAPGPLEVYACVADKDCRGDRRCFDGYCRLARPDSRDAGAADGSDVSDPPCAAATAADGEPCSSACECPGRVCLAPDGGPGTCRTLCGGTSDCPDGGRCDPLDDAPGLNACRPATGSRLDGESCEPGGDNLCRSGVCENGTECADRCASARHCGDAGDTCWLRPLETGGAEMRRECWPPDGRTDEFPADCTASCRSNGCIRNGGPQGSACCLTGCCTSRDCGDQGVCRMIRPVLAGRPGVNAVGPTPGCVAHTGIGTGKVGDPCLDGSACRSALCVGQHVDGRPTASRYCTDTCCSAADCKDGFACAAMMTAGEWTPVCLCE